MIRRHIPRRTPAALAQPRGFTLIELLVVIVILGIAVALLLPNLGSLRDDRDLQREARRLVALIELARDEAALQGRELGVRFGRDNYVFYDLDPVTGAWVELAGDDMLRARTLPEDTEFNLWLENREILLRADAREHHSDDDEDSSELRVGPPPHVAILSSGEMTPFVLRLRQDFATDDITIRGDVLGGIEFGSVDES